LSYGNQRGETLRVRLPLQRNSQVVAHIAQQPLEPQRIAARHPQAEPISPTTAQLSRATRSAPFLAFVLRDSRLHQFLNKCSRQWLIRGELDGPFRCIEALKFVLERCDNRRSGEQTTVVRKRGEPHQHSFVLERRNPIADGLGSLLWHSGPNRCANLVQGAAGGFRDTSKVFINAFRSALSLRDRTAIGRFRFFHADNATRTSTSSPCPGLG